MRNRNNILHPLGRKGKPVEVKLGVCGKDVKTKEDIQGIRRHWLELKLFCKTNVTHNLLPMF